MLSQAELNAMPRRTPTGIAEERFAALARTMQIGPSGLPVPRARSAYRPSEAALLTKIHRTAFGAYERKVLPWERIQQVASVLVADIERRFPHADMLVLERYGFASKQERITVTLPGYRHYKIDLPEPILATGKAGVFTLDLADAPLLAPVPDSLREFFARVIDIEHERDSMGIGQSEPLNWIAGFRRRAQRMPKWQEIEDTFPIIGNWLADERKRMEAANG